MIRIYYYYNTYKIFVNQNILIREINPMKTLHSFTLPAEKPDIL